MTALDSTPGDEDPANAWRWYLAAGLIGLADAGFQSQAYTVTGAVFSDELKVHAFAVFSVLQHFGLTVAWVSVTIWPPSEGKIFAVYFLVTGVIAAVSTAAARQGLLEAAAGGGNDWLTDPIIEHETSDSSNRVVVR